MILQALYEYYNRKLERGEIAPEGFVERAVDFLVVLNNDGKYVDLEGLQSLYGKKMRGRPYHAPAIGKQALKHTMAGDDANLLWDKSDFVLGTGKSGEKKLDSFIDTIHTYYPAPPHDVQAILKFYTNERKKEKPFQRIVEHEEFGEMIKSGAPIISFRIQENTTPVFCQSHVIEALSNRSDPSEVLGACLITGDTKVPIGIYHPVIKRIRGSQPAGANLVSFDDAAFRSFGKSRGMNAPVSKRAVAGYTKALQSLVDCDGNRVRIGDSTTVFWAGRKDENVETYNLESDFRWFVSDDPDRGVQAVKSLFRAMHTGRLAASNDNFYVLGLATPSKSRISIRFFRKGKVREIGERIIKHVEDTSVEDFQDNSDNKHITISELLASISLETRDGKKPNAMYFRGRYYDVLPNLSGAIVESILDGSRYPATLLQQCVRRIRAEVARKDQNGKLMQNVTRTRAAILKASLNRIYRSQHHNTNKEVLMALDPQNKDIAYLLGRLFALLERIQEESARPSKLNSTIRERFYASFSSSPSVVMPLLMRLKNHHLAKLGAERDYLKRWFEERVGEVINLLESTNIPAHLTLEQQAQFAVGYYHQRMYRQPKQS